MKICILGDPVEAIKCGKVKRTRTFVEGLSTTAKILILAWGRVEGQKKLTKVVATGVLRGLVPRGPTENAVSQSILRLRS